MDRRTQIVVLVLGIGVPIGVTVTQYFENRPEPEVVVTFDYSRAPWQEERQPKETTDLVLSLRNDPAGFLLAMQSVSPQGNGFWSGSGWFDYKGQRAHLTDALPEKVRPYVFGDGEIRDWLPADPVRSLQSFRMFKPEEDPGSYAIACLAIWTSHDPIAASLWYRDHAATFSQGGMDRAAGEIAAQWCRQNPAAAARWVRKLFGAAREDAAYAMVTELVWSDPADAATWTVDVVEPKRHAAAVAQVALFWLHADPAAAEAWIRSDALSAEERQMVTQHFGLAP